MVDVLNSTGPRCRYSPHPIFPIFPFPRIIYMRVGKLKMWKNVFPQMGGGKIGKIRNNRRKPDFLKLIEPNLGRKNSNFPQQAGKTFFPVFPHCCLYAISRHRPISAIAADASSTSYQNMSLPPPSTSGSWWRMCLIGRFTLSPTGFGHPSQSPFFASRSEAGNKEYVGSSSKCPLTLEFSTTNA